MTITYSFAPVALAIHSRSSPPAKSSKFRHTMSRDSPSLIGFQCWRRWGRKCRWWGREREAFCLTSPHADTSIILISSVHFVLKLKCEHVTVPMPESDEPTCDCAHIPLCPRFSPMCPRVIVPTYHCAHASVRCAHV